MFYVCRVDEKKTGMFNCVGQNIGNSGQVSQNIARLVPTQSNSFAFNNLGRVCRIITRTLHFYCRLIHQEKTTQTLIDKAYKIKEDIIESMNLSHGSWQNEKEARVLLTDHIRNITVIVKRLSREIEVQL